MEELQPESRTCVAKGTQAGQARWADLELTNELCFSHHVAVLQLLRAAPVFAQQHIELLQVVVQVLHVLVNLLLLSPLLLYLPCAENRGRGLAKAAETPQKGQGWLLPFPSGPSCGPYLNHSLAGLGVRVGISSWCYSPKAWSFKRTSRTPGQGPLGVGERARGRRSGLLLEVGTWASLRHLLWRTPG